VVKQLQQLFPAAHPYVHPKVPSAVIVPGTGPLQPDYASCGEWPGSSQQDQQDPPATGQVLIINPHARPAAAINACWLLLRHQ